MDLEQIIVAAGYVITLGYLRYSPDDFHELLGECRSAETIGSTRLGKIHIQDNSPIGANAVVNEVMLPVLSNRVLCRFVKRYCCILFLS